MVPAGQFSSHPVEFVEVTVEGKTACNVVMIVNAEVIARTKEKVSPFMKMLNRRRIRYYLKA